jgi:hypothetical protein
MGMNVMLDITVEKMFVNGMKSSFYSGIKKFVFLCILLSPLIMTFLSVFLKHEHDPTWFLSSYIYGSVLTGFYIILVQESLLYKSLTCNSIARKFFLWLMLVGVAFGVSSGLFLDYLPLASELKSPWFFTFFTLFIFIIIKKSESEFRSSIRANIAIRKMKVELRKIPEHRKFYYLGCMNKIMNKYRLWDADISKERTVKMLFLNRNKYEKL